MPLNHLNNSNFVRPNPGMGSIGLRKLRLLWSKEAQAPTPFKDQAQALLKLNFQDSNWPGIDPSLPVPKFHDSIYQTL